MKLLIAIVVTAMLLLGCVNISDTAKAASFGKNAKEQKALDYFTKKYGDPNGPGAPRIIEPFMTSSVSDFMPADKVVKYSKDAPSFIIWFFYDNFGKSDAITVTYTYLDGNTEIHAFNSNGGGDYGAATFTLQAPDGGWPVGKYRASVSGKGVGASVDFEVIDGQTVSVPLPYDSAVPAAGSAPATAPPAGAAAPDGSGTPGGDASKTSAATTDSIVFDTTPGYIGACSLTDTSRFTLDAPISASLLQIWYSWKSGESSLAYTLTKDGADFSSGTMVRADCDPYQGNWCNGNQILVKEFPAGSYELKIPSKKMCLEPGKTGTVRIYGKKSSAASAPASGAGFIPSKCTLVGDWKWYNADHFYAREDGTWDSWKGGSQVSTGTWTKQSDTAYTIKTSGGASGIVLKDGCSRVEGNNQWTADIKGEKLSDSVPPKGASTSATLPAGIPAHLTACDYSGNYNTDWGGMTLSQSGSAISGTYTHDSGKLSGAIVDGVFVGKWSESPSYKEPGDGGDAVFYFTKDCNSFTGSWQYGVHTTGSWSGGWVGTKAP